jgi:hypothetical protein
MQAYQRRKDFIRHGAIRLRDPLAHHRPHCHTHTPPTQTRRETGRERKRSVSRTAQKCVVYRSQSYTGPHRVSHKVMCMCVRVCVCVGGGGGGGHVEAGSGTVCGVGSTAVLHREELHGRLGRRASRVVR